MIWQSVLHHRPRDGTTDPSANAGASDIIGLMLGLHMPPDLIFFKKENGRNFERMELHSQVCKTTLRGIPAPK